MATLDGAWAAARELRDVNGGRPDIKLALWAAALSASRSLDVNADLYQPLRTGAPLPQDPAAVLSLLKAGHGFVCANDARHILYAEWADREGLLDPYRECPGTLAEWRAWRQGLYEILAGHGWNLKTISFAGLLMWPTRCPLVPVDRHVMARLGHTAREYKRLSKCPKLYQAIEQEVAEEWLAAGQPRTLGVWHWYKWSEYRQGKRRETPGDAVESHARLSPTPLLSLARVA